MKVYCNYHSLQGECTQEDYDDAVYGRNPSGMVRVRFPEFSHAVPLNSLTKIVDLQSAHSQGYATYGELKRVGMKKKFDLGQNEWGFLEHVIIDNDDRQWDYIPEDNIYELREDTEQRYLNLL